MLHDLRAAFRALQKRPGLTLAATITLALGIGATTTIYSVVHAALLRPLAFAHPEELVQLVPLRGGRLSSQLSYPDFRDIRAALKSFASLAPFRFYLFNLSGSDAPESVLGLFAGADLLPLLGVTPSLGRQFRAGSDEVGGIPEAMLTDQLWRRRYGADPAIIGRSLTIDGRPVTVAGILPASFQIGALTPSDVPLSSREPEVFVTIGAEADPHDQRGNSNYWVLGRLAPGVARAAADAELAPVIQRLAEDYPRDDAGLEVHALNLQAQIVGDSGRPILILLGAVSLLLLIACANVAGLLAARAVDRQRETSIRVALGASQWRLATQVLAEGLTLALVGGAGGVLLAVWAIPAFRSAAPNTLPRLAEATLDVQVVVAAIGLTLLTALLAALPPVLGGARAQPADALKEGGRGSRGPHGRRLRRVLTIAQVALSLVLLCGAGLLVRSLLLVTGVQAGFATDHVLTMMTILPQAGYGDPMSQRRFAERSVEAIRGVPGVEAVGAVNVLPLSNLGSSTSIEIPGAARLEPGPAPEILYRIVAGDYFGALQIPTVAGRNFSPGDTAGAAPVAMVNGTMARQFFGSADPVGRRIHLGNDGSGIDRTVIGVVGDTRETGLDAAPVPHVYYPMAQGPEPMVSLAIRTRGDPRALLPAVRRSLAGVDAGIGFFAARTMEELMAGTLARRRFNVEMLAAFAAAALLLSAVGLYGVIAYSATQRAREIGIRMALGAKRAEVVWLFLREGLVLAGLGAAAGLVAALGLGRLLASQLYGIGAADPLALFAVTVLLAAVAIAAALIPARRATRVDPGVVLRSE